MAAETAYIVVALPHSARAGDDFHVSLFVSPKLVPDGGEGLLNAHPAFVGWTKRLRRASFTLIDQEGPIECEARLERTDESIWPKLFPPGRTPVRAQKVPDWSGRPVNSFDTRNVATLSKAIQAASVLASPLAPPKVDEHPLTPGMRQIAEGCMRPDRRFTVDKRNQVRFPVYDESIATAALDELLASGRREGRLLGSVLNLTEATATSQTVLARMAVELHRARRFYERPESLAENPYAERPTEQPKSLPPRTPEFHERCVTCGDHPTLLRKLGLVVDLRVTDPDRLLRSQWLQARIDVPDAICHTTQTLCRATADRSLVTVATGDDWADGALTLGREDRFVVLDIDTDGSALKSERYLWSIPRMDAVERNGDEIDAASPALRSSGLTVARTGQAAGSRERIDRQRALEGSLASSPRLTTEDVTRGMRVEVWDDEVKRWNSLHQRLTDVTVDGFGLVLDDLEDEGFIQGTASSTTPGAAATAPVYVHEAMFGWDGWSLSAPRPGKRIRKATPAEVAADPEHRTEVVEDVPADLPKKTHPILFSNQAKPGSLPRLRYGRSYAFRAWQVDLAGNTRPHELDPEPVAPEPQVAAALTDLLAAASPEGARLWSTAFRAVTSQSLSASRVVVQSEEPELPQRLVSLVAPALRHRARPVLPGRAADGRLRSVRRTAVLAAAEQAVTALDHPLVRETAVADADRVSSLVASQLSALKLAGPALVAQAFDTVTRLKPFLRWDPVQPPAVVPRRAYTEGESLRVLVVRSGVTQDPDTLEITVTDPAAYSAANPRYAATSERHLAPPKTTQITAELHGLFDRGIGSSATEQSFADAMLAVALTEDGSLSDVDRADLDDPANRIPQPGVSMVDPPVPQTELKSLPLPVGEGPAPGQYVVHDTDELTIPYLPDPLAEGVSFVFPEAGKDRPVPLPFPFGGEGFTTAYGGEWPRIEPYRLVLSGSDELDGKTEGRVIDLRLPPGDIQRLRMSSSIPKDKLGLLGPLASISKVFATNAEVEEAAADGWLWSVSPAESLKLVHAVPRPIAAPRPTVMRARRRRSQTWSWLEGGIDLHGPSTDNVTAEAGWTEFIDDIAAAGPVEQGRSEAAFQVPIREWEDIAVLSDGDFTGNVPGFGPVAVHRAVHQFPDTRHRRVSYRFRATTRFREYFAPELIAPSGVPGDFVDDGRSVVAAPVVVDVPSSEPPAAPVVHSVIPLFRWDYGTEPEQPMARRHVRRAGVRIYLERPWYSSGEGELLAVLLAGRGGDFVDPPPEDGSGFPWVSKVGSDPVWHAAEWPRRPMALATLEHFLAVHGIEDRADPARPVAISEPLELPWEHGTFSVQAVGYRPQYNASRKLWYVDVAMDPGHTMWSFVRLAVARYQPSSVDGCHLSKPVRCDFVQLPPERTLSVNRTDGRHVRVVLAGAVGTRTPIVSVVGRRLPSYPELVTRHRIVVARLQRKDPLIAGDLGWQTVATEQLPIRASDEAEHEAVWTGELGAAEDILLRRPVDEESTWRVTVEEWERFPGDRPSPMETGPVLAVPGPVWEQRLVFADEVML